MKQDVAAIIIHTYRNRADRNTTIEGAAMLTRLAGHAVTSVDLYIATQATKGDK